MNKYSNPCKGVHSLLSMMKNLCFVLLAAAIVVSSQKYRDDDEFVPEIMAEVVSPS